MVGDISHGILTPFAAQCPDRYFNVGICEPTILGLAAGVAKTGLIPVVHTIAPFIIERGYEQIKLDFGYQQLGVNLISVGSAFDYSQLGCSHHCYTDFSLMSHFAQSQIFFPSSPLEFKILFQKTYNNHKKINYFRLPEKPHGVVFHPDQIQVGKAIQITEGTDLTCVVIGPLLKNAMQAAEILKTQGIETEILYYPTIKPFDREAVIKSATKTKKIVVIEEASSHDGVFNSVLRATLPLSGIQYHSISIPDFIYGYGSYEDLCEIVGMHPEGIVAAVLTIFKDAKTTSLC
jgi:transketolase